mgnify:FL=1|jgi:hypothetical protein
MRNSAKTWTCIICGNEAMDAVVCYSCTLKEWKRQKELPGSITAAQIYFIEKQLGKLDSTTSYNILFEVVPEYNYDMELLSTEQAKEITAKLLDAISNKIAA